MVTITTQFANHPYHGEQYDELEPYSYNEIEDSNGVLFVEERIKYNQGNIQAFSIIILCNKGNGYRPLFEIQHEPRNRYPQSVDLRNNGLKIWEMSPEYIRLGKLPCNCEPNFRNSSSPECYNKIKEEYFDIIVTKTFEKLVGLNIA